ncbi:hypothetical protein TWF102_003689 [Orbilia oligospora]|uniref:Uncharacterized protein n=1 Tax=Orbilia oligospora TaxID=2813651 RepID=A0A7C8NIJ5_ORBOL|nr:hypothetical protein TWF102_003689 [Orbilia oligospora]KAF3105193.1 hypothetical protein TWF103_006658 [Orbilia oligospora]KAF3106124.1 hypothetical protein TWF706_003510 [Orbilia oligospora]KAF3152361.1 hypothetical protein TWF594_004057 [Orbilia oligospora]
MTRNALTGWTSRTSFFFSKPALTQAGCSGSLWLHAVIDRMDAAPGLVQVDAAGTWHGLGSPNLEFLIAATLSEIQHFSPDPCITSGVTSRPSSGSSHINFAL